VFANGELPLERSPDLGDVHGGGAAEYAGFRDLHYTAVHRRFNASFDYERVAIGDLHAFQLDIGTDDQLAAGGLLLRLGRPGRLCDTIEPERVGVRRRLPRRRRRIERGRDVDVRWPGVVALVFRFLAEYPILVEQFFSPFICPDVFRAGGAARKVRASLREARLKSTSASYAASLP
jgi:hypothetical protein